MATTRTKQSRSLDSRVIGATADMVRHILKNLGELTVADNRRVTKLLPLICDAAGGPIAELAACSRALFRGDDDKLYAFLWRVNQASNGMLELHTTKSEESSGVIGFFVPINSDDTERQIIRHADASSDLPDFVIDNPALPNDPAGKPVQHFTVLHADADTRIATPLITALRAHLRASKKFAHDLWDQSKILTGKHPQEEIETALRRSNYVIVLLSAEFLSDGSLSGARTLIRNRQCIPVALSALSAHHDVDEFAGKIYRGKRRSWSGCTNAANREAFVVGLFEEIERVVESSLAGEDELRMRLQEHARASTVMPECVLDSDVTKTDLRGAVTAALRAVEPQSGLQMLLDWAERPGGPHYACILGEFGIGKTTLLKRWTQELLRRREAGEPAPLPIFLDLRTYMGSIEGLRSQQSMAKLPRLEPFLRELLEGAWKHAGPAPEPSQLLKLVRDEGAVVIVDGLDEKLVHLSEAQGAELIRLLWGILPPTLFRKPAPGRRPGRLVISCRSHVFPTLQKQNAMFTGGLRDEVRAEDYLALVVLPFSEEKIREYLWHHLRDRVDDALALIKSIHNLTDLAPRPLFLDLIRKQIAHLEEMAARGEPVRGVSLYDHLIEQCSLRDEPKHTIRPEDKPRFMEAIAAAMWREGAREWPWDRVFHWLREHIVGDPVLLEAYPLSKEHTARIAEDFRTATMVVRPDQGNFFRFAHTSMQEYFLARWLYRALIESRPGDWDVSMPSDETLDFLGQLLFVRGSEAWRTTLEELLFRYRPRASRLAFRYWLQACKCGHPRPQPTHASLPGENFDGWTIAGTPGSPLVLRGADLRGVSLREAWLQHVDLRGADLTDADLVCAALEHADLGATKITRADFTGSLWRDCEVGETEGRAKSWWDSEWVRTQNPPGLQSIEAAMTDPPVGAVAEVRGGFSRSVLACAYSPDGNSIVSGSSDGVLKIWDARSGRLRLILSRHSGPVVACAFSADGTSILSHSNNGEMKIWEVPSGRLQRTLPGIASEAMARAFSRDGSILVSVGNDGTLKIWDTESGLARHSQRVSVYVSTCALSPNGESVVLGSHDGALMVRELHNNRVRQMLSRHSKSVHACAYSPDGESVVSGSDDQTLSVWDARSGQARITLSGHSAAVRACAYSPDAGRIASGSIDRTLRVWDARSGRALFTFAGYPTRVTGYACSVDGRSTVQSMDNGTLIVRHTKSGRAQSIIHVAEAVTACACGPDGTVVVGQQDGILNVRPAGETRVRPSLSRHSKAVRACALSPDGRGIVSGSEDGTIKLWDVDTMKARGSLTGHTHAVTMCAYSPDGASVVSGSYDGKLKIWTLRGGPPRATPLGHHRAVTACAFSKDGTRLVSGADDGTLKVWTVGRGRENRALPGTRNAITSCAFSPDEANIVSGSKDGSIQVLDADSGHVQHSLSGHLGPVVTCAYDADDGSLVSASLDGTMKFWNPSTGQLLRTIWCFEDFAAEFDDTTRRFVWATPNAWRYLCYRGFDPERGAFRVYSIEASEQAPM